MFSKIGHRKRMRKRFLKTSAASFEEYELLEMLLFSAITRSDVQDTAKKLIKTFGNIRGILEAREEELRKIHGIGDSAIVLIKLVNSLTILKSMQNLQSKTNVKAYDQVIDYVKSELQEKKFEVLLILFIDSKGKIITSKIHSQFSFSSVKISAKQILKNALNHDAKYIMLAHNHPSDDNRPSNEDIKTTAELKKMLHKFDIELLDHIIITPNGTNSSMFKMGYIPNQ